MATIQLAHTLRLEHGLAELTKLLRPGMTAAAIVNRSSGLISPAANRDQALVFATPSSCSHRSERKGEKSVVFKKERIGRRKKW
jgi:hypothetical protein